MSQTTILLMIAGVFIFLWLAWVLKYGFSRGSLAIALRLVWISPLIFALFPKIKSFVVPSSVSLMPVHVLVDDSLSMQSSGFISKIEAQLIELKELCRRYSCTLKITRLSELDTAVKENLSPIRQNLGNWIFTTNDDLWVFLSDGGDSKPTLSWPLSFQGLGLGKLANRRGLVVSYLKSESQNIWVESIDPLSISFEDKPSVLHVLVGRENSLGELSVQLQVSSSGRNLATKNILFREGEDRLEVEITLAQLVRGQHLLSVEALPLKGEKTLWDNRMFTNVEVLPNTIGILHLLGSPSWDGRFVRRYLKSEPKYDLISFFILRDPVDMQLTNERELSLIPFPVERLFNEELPNFRTVVLQNFSLYQFLEPAYQRNLVEYVKNGGSLLFLGGPRALHASDYVDSPLAEIIPFEASEDIRELMKTDIVRRFTGGFDAQGPYFDRSQEFKIEFAEPSSEQRELASIFDDWKSLSGELTLQTQLQGIHRSDQVKFRENEYTPLLVANTSDGKRLPLAVASYPGKGRAVWIFTDSLWRMGLNPSQSSSRELYYRFLDKTFTWLLKNEMRKALRLSELNLEDTGRQTDFSLYLHGPASSYFEQFDTSKLLVCNLSIASDEVIAERIGDQKWRLSGSLPTKLEPGKECLARIEASHPAFGSLNASVGGVLPEVFDDFAMEASGLKINQLVSTMKADSINGLADDFSFRFEEWLRRTSGQEGLTNTLETRRVEDFYWILDYWWVWLLFLGLPLEVIVRRWPQISGRSI